MPDVVQWGDHSADIGAVLTVLLVFPEEPRATRDGDEGVSSQLDGKLDSARLPVRTLRG